MKVGDRIQFTADVVNALEEVLFESGEIATVMSLFTQGYSVVSERTNRVRWLPKWAKFFVLADDDTDATARSLYATFSFMVSSIVASNLAAPACHSYKMLPWDATSNDLRDLLISVAAKMHDQMSGRDLQNIMRYIDNAVAQYRMEQS